MNDREKTIERIRKLLALARSSNPHEAAQALERAQAMMADHGLDQGAPELNDIAAFEARFVMSRAVRWPGYVSRLCGAIRRAFGVESICIDNAHVWFYGATARAQVAAYAFDALGRQCIKARREFFESQRNRIKRATRIGRADQFAEGWVSSATRHLSRIAPTQEEKLLLERFERERWGETSVIDVRAAAEVRGNFEARFKGHVAGADARLEFGVAGGVGGAPARIGQG